MLPNTPSFPLHYTVRERTQSPPHHHPVSTRGIYSPSPHHSLSGEGGYVDQRINHAHSPSPATKPLHACSSFITHTVSVSPIPFRCIFVAPHPPHVTNANHTHPKLSQGSIANPTTSIPNPPKPPSPSWLPRTHQTKALISERSAKTHGPHARNLNRRVTVQRHVKFRQASQAFLLNEMREGLARPLGSETVGVFHLLWHLLCGR